jgi:hypothetical protein
MIKSIEDQYVIDVEIDPAIHARIIGAKGRSVKKTMDTYKVMKQTALLPKRRSFP